MWSEVWGEVWDEAGGVDDVLTSAFRNILAGPATRLAVWGPARSSMRPAPALACSVHRIRSL